MISRAANVAIIGGADGPTQIFVASTVFDWLTPVLLFVIPVLLIAFSVYLLKKAKR